MPKALDETWRLLDDFADAARALTQVRSAHDVAELLCRLTLDVVGGDHASITSVRQGRATTVAATSEVPERGDKIQYATGQGPCLEAVREHATFRVDDLSSDPRWPAFGLQAVAELGVRSMIAHVLPVEDQVLGAVNVYAMRQGAFHGEHETLIAILGATAVQAIGAVHHQAKAEHLERAMHTNRHIGVALGILMTTRQVNLDQAWEILSKASQDRNVKVSVLADRVIGTGSLDERWGD